MTLDAASGPGGFLCRTTSPITRGSDTSMSTSRLPGIWQLRVHRRSSLRRMDSRQAPPPGSVRPEATHSNHQHDDLRCQGFCRWKIAQHLVARSCQRMHAPPPGILQRTGWRPRWPDPLPAPCRCHLAACEEPRASISAVALAHALSGHHRQEHAGAMQCGMAGRSRLSSRRASMSSRRSSTEFGLQRSNVACLCRRRAE